MFGKFFTARDSFEDFVFQGFHEYLFTALHIHYDNINNVNFWVLLEDKLFLILVAIISTLGLIESTNVTNLSSITGDSLDEYILTVLMRVGICWRGYEPYCW